MEADLLIALRVSGEGYGSLDQVMDMRVDLVMAAMEYIAFRSEFEDTAYELNKPPK